MTHPRTRRRSDPAFVRRPRTRRVAALAAIAAMTVATAAVPSDVGAIPRETGAAGLAARRYGQPVVALASYATPTYSGCSATMIGPSIMMTAGHCRASRQVTFIAYAEDGSRITESFDTRQIQHTWIDTDLVLHYVSTNAAGERPGDKFGYLDFELMFSPSGAIHDQGSAVRPGQRLFSLWNNPVDAIDPNVNQLLYSEGKIVSTDGTGWFAPNLPDGSTTWRCNNGGPSDPIAVSSDVFGVPGASGSSSIDPSTGRVVLGPLSTTGTTRAQLSILDYLRFGFANPDEGVGSCDPGALAAVAERVVAGLGVVEPRRFYGHVDGNRDGVFDIQSAIERVEGESRRDVYALDFVSPRQDARWDWDRQVASIDHGGTVHLDATSPGLGAEVEALRHDGLDLAPGVEHRLAIGLRGLADGDAAVRVEIVDVNGVAALDETLTGSAVLSFSLDDRLDHLSIHVRRGATVVVEEVDIVHADATFDFDDHDSRVMWNLRQVVPPRTPPALVWPDGMSKVPPANGIDWAGVVAPGISDLVVDYGRLGIADGEQFRVCFAHRLSKRAGFTTATASPARLAFSGVASSDGRATTTFVPGSSWMTTCSDELKRSDALVNGMAFTWPKAPRSAAYLIDDIVVERVDG